MKICVYVGELDIRGGTHKQVLRLAQYLHGQGHAVWVVSPTFDAVKTYEEFGALNVVSLGPKPPSGGPLRRRWTAFLAPWRLARMLPKVDVLNIHDNRGVAFFRWMSLLGRFRASVWQINDLHPAFQLRQPQVATHGLRAILDRLHRAANRTMARQVNAITVNVSKNAVRVKEALERPAQVVYCGVDIPAVPPVATLPVAAPDGRPLKVLSTGVFFPYRNYLRLVQACANVRDALGRDVELTIIGDTRYAPDYAQEVRQAAQASGVRMRVLENVAQPELESEMASHHVFAFVNIDQSWGLAVFEAAARQRPVVLSRSVGACELLAGRPGFALVDPEDTPAISRALQDWLSDPAACARAAADARREVETMTWDRMYGQPVEALFRDILGGRNPS